VKKYGAIRRPLEKGLQSGGLLQASRGTAGTRERKEEGLEAGSGERLGVPSVGDRHDFGRVSARTNFEGRKLSREEGEWKQKLTPGTPTASEQWAHISQAVTHVESMGGGGKSCLG